MIIKNIQQPEYNVNGSIDCVVDIIGVGKSLPFTASPDDPEAHGRKLFDDLEAGKYGSIAKCPSDAVKQERVGAAKIKRGVLSDKADLTIRTLSDEKEAEVISDEDLVRWKEWIRYRKALRELDITSDDIQWPSQPE